MPRNTPWSASSSLPSDRIKSSTPNVARPASSKGKGKSKEQKDREQEQIKSARVRTLESLLSELGSANGKEKDKRGGCFCLARSHSLSPYTPLCPSCGLILCALNPPTRACPSCNSAHLLRPGVRDSLSAQVAAELEEQKEKEERERIEREEEAKRAVGAFPALPGAAPAVGGVHGHPQVKPQPQTHKVMSLTAGTRRGANVLVSSYTTTTSSRPTSRAPSGTSTPREPEEDVTRVPAPPDFPPHVPSQAQAPPHRPWANLLDPEGCILYIPPKRVCDDNEPGDAGASGSGSGKRKKGGKGKGKDNEKGA